MKLLISSLLLFFSFCSFASTKSFSYEEVSVKLGLNVISVGNPWTFPGIHRFYSDEGFSRAMLVMENVAGWKEKLQIIEYPSFTLIEYPVSSSKYNSVALINISRSQVETYILQLDKSVSNPLESFLSILFPRAHADDSCETNSLETFTGPSLVTISKFYSYNYVQLASSCVTGVLEGAWDSTGGMVESFNNGLKKLSSDPKGFWEEKVESFSRMKSFFMEFELNMQRTLTSFKNMPDEVKAQMLCSFIGSIGTDSLIAILTAGASSAKIASSLQSFTNKFLRLEGLMSKLIQLGKIKEIPAKFYDNVMKNLVSERRLSSIEAFVHHDFDDLALKLVKCSL